VRVGVLYELTYITEHTSTVSFCFRTQLAGVECGGMLGKAREFPNLAAPAVSAQKANKVPSGCSRSEPKTKEIKRENEPGPVGRKNATARITR